MSLATFGTLEDLLLKISSKTRKTYGGCFEVCAQFLFPSKTRSTVAESVASRSFYSLSTITESVANRPLPGFRHQQFRSRHRADDACGFPQTQITQIVGSENLKILAQSFSDVRKMKISSVTKWPGESQMNPIPPCHTEDGGSFSFFLTGEMLELVLPAKTFTTGPEDLLKKCHCLYCLTCRKETSMKSR